MAMKAVIDFLNEVAEIELGPARKRRATWLEMMERRKTCPHKHLQLVSRKLNAYKCRYCGKLIRKGEGQWISAKSPAR